MGFTYSRSNSPKFQHALQTMDGWEWLAQGWRTVKCINLEQITDAAPHTTAHIPAAQVGVASPTQHEVQALVNTPLLLLSEPTQACA